MNMTGNVSKWLRKRERLKTDPEFAQKMKQKIIDNRMRRHGEL
jgi:hypothetical protein